MLARVLILLVILAVAESCIQHTDCESCTRGSRRVRFKIISCRWCPFRSTCHTEGTTDHGCDDYEVALTSQCVNATQLVIRYLLKPHIL
ncbi:hypothetical protein EB796_007233 [Bugula neritina]|uniref:Uncharacterized protein n=1 Tax=Bugula neritina TaxID=10212 RepID=A0A7J7K875_BUGNE|nr:hypothetical protein EB796_007233 [Bugula neritina]